MDEQLDELLPEEEQPAEPDPAEPSTPKADQTVPLSRFQEVYHKQKELEQEVSALKDQKKSEGLTPEQEKELQAKQYLKNLLKETLSEQEQTKAQAEAQEQAKFEREVDEALMAQPDVKREDFLKFVEEKSDRYGLESVSGSMKVYLDLQQTHKEAGEKARESLLGKPGLPSSEGSGKYQGPPPEDKTRSFGGVVQDILKGLK